MPELPEVETVRRGLSRAIKHRTIQQVDIRYHGLIKRDKTLFEQALMGKTIEAIKRRGKYLLFDLGDLTLISHLRMEGKYLIFPNEVPENKHFHSFFYLDNQETLVYQDVRKFGTMDLVETSQIEDFFKKKRLGPEPNETEFLLQDFSKALKKSKKKIKSHLLDQTLVAGLGNIYVDEVLWSAKIHPERLSNSLSDTEISALHHDIISILQLGIAKGGSTIRTYKNALGESGKMQDYLNVYQKVGQPCVRCLTPIEKIKVGGRGTHICSSCQIR